MAKKIFAFGLVIVVFASFWVSTFAQVPNGEDQMAPLNPEFLKYLELRERSPIQLQMIDGRGLGAIPSPHIQPQGQPLSQASMPLAYTATYDLRNYNKVTPVRNQGSCGSCWAFATYGSLESYLKPGEDRDFSEQNLKNTHGFDYTPCDGGSAEMSTAYLARWRGTYTAGPINETDDPYWPDESHTSPPGLTLQKHVQKVLYLPYRSSYTGNDNIKWAITTYGALMTWMCWDDAYYRYQEGPPERAAYYSNISGTCPVTETTGGHLVAVIGWDDNYPVANFNPTNPPPGPGAFLAKNSWGTGWGEDGYFWISYYDTKVNPYALFNNAEGTTNYSDVYQYDPLGWVDNYGNGTNVGWGANIFTADSIQLLVAVSTYAVYPNASYEVYIYTNVTPEQPRSGTLAGTKTGSFDSNAYGYYTIPLNSTIPLTSGEKFSVVIKYTTPGYNYPIPAEFDVTGYSSGATANAGESFRSYNGTDWSDVTVVWDSSANVCIKAFMNNYSEHHTLTVTRAGTGLGTVTSVPQGINCGPDCTELYDSSWIVTLTASAAVGSTFTGWSGEGCSGTDTCVVTMDADRNVTATFMRSILCPEFPVSVNTSTQQYPAIYGNIVVWQDARNPDSDIYGYDMGSDGELGTADDGGEFRIAPDNSGQVNPDIYGNIVIFRVQGSVNNFDIYGYNLTTSTTFEIMTANSNQHNALIYGNVVIWRDGRNDSGNGNWEIYGCNLPCGAGSEIRITNDAVNQESLAIYGNIIVWDDYRNLSTTGHDIYGYDMGPDGRLGTADDRGQFRVTINSSDQNAPDIYGSIIIWQDFRNGSADIYGYDMGPDGVFGTTDDVGEFAISTVPSWQWWPRIYNNVVVWVDQRNSPSDINDIYGFDLNTHTEFPIVTGSGEQWYPELYGNTIVWQDRRDDNGDIYGTCLIQSQSTTTLYIPYVVDTTTQRTNVAIGNDSVSAADVTVYFYTPDGNLHAQRTATVPPHGYTQFNSVIRWVKNVSNLTNLEGYLKIESNQPIYAVGSQNDNVSNDPSAILGKRLSDANTNIDIPVVLNIGTSWNSFIVIDNMGLLTATVDLHTYNYDGSYFGKFTIPGGIVAGGQWSAQDIGATLGLSDGFYGMVIIVSTQPIFALVRGYTAQNTGACLEGVTSLSSTLFIPYVVDTAAQRTNVAVGNDSASTANITLYYYTPDGQPNAQRTATVPPHGYTQFNSVIRWVRNLGETSPTNLAGYIKIVSDQATIYAVGSQNDNVSNDPSATLGKTISQAYSEGVIPVILNLSTSWNSFIVIDNMGSLPANITLTFYNYTGMQTGSPYTISNLVVSGQWSSSDIGATMNLSDGVYGMLKITSSQPILASVRGYTAQNTGAFLEMI